MSFSDINHLLANKFQKALPLTQQHPLSLKEGHTQPIRWVDSDSQDVPEPFPDDDSNGDNNGQPDHAGGNDGNADNRHDLWQIG